MRGESCVHTMFPCFAFIQCFHAREYRKRWKSPQIDVASMSGATSSAKSLAAMAVVSGGGLRGTTARFSKNTVSTVVAKQIRWASFLRLCLRAVLAVILVVMVQEAVGAEFDVLRHLCCTPRLCKMCLNVHQRGVGRSYTR